MRIVAGQWRGRKLETPAGWQTRPTSDRVREALFSMLASRLGSFADLRIADLFAGSGALGLEALSRGAAQCTFVERDQQALTALRANIAQLDAEATVLARSVETLPPAGQPFDLIVMDPPYDTDLASVAMAASVEKGWIGPSTWLSVETVRGASPMQDGLELDTQRSFGKAQITLFRANLH
jgi:16S rRNA (guanine966-N2)-methyltransferase